MLSKIKSKAACVALALGCVTPLSALASVVYEFSLPANGAVGAVEIRWTQPSFVSVGGLSVTNLSDATITFTSGTPLTAAASVIGFDQDPTETLFGLMLQASAGGLALFTSGYPADFFRFARDFDDEGTFSSTAGNVTSSAFSLDTPTPTAILCVSSTGACDGPAGVPAPATGALALLGLAALRLSRRRAR